MSNGTEVAQQEEAKRKGSLFVRVVRFIVRLLVVIVFGIALGAAIYYGVPTLYRSTIQPIQINAQRIADLEQDLNQAQTSSRKQLEQAGERLAEVEGSLAEQEETLAAMEAELEGMRSALNDQSDQISELRRLARQVEELASDLIMTADRVQELEIALADIGFPAERIERQLQMVRAMTLLTKARLWLIQDNLGFAADEIAVARDLLIGVVGDEIEEEGEIQEVIERLDLALADIRTTPIVAADELEIAWKLLVVATSPEVVQATPTLELSP